MESSNSDDDIIISTHSEGKKKSFCQNNNMESFVISFKSWNWEPACWATGKKATLTMHCVHGSKTGACISACRSTVCHRWKSSTDWSGHLFFACDISTAQDRAEYLFNVLCVESASEYLILHSDFACKSTGCRCGRKCRWTTAFCESLQKNAQKTRLEQAAVGRCANSVKTCSETNDTNPARWNLRACDYDMGSQVRKILGIRWAPRGRKASISNWTR